jgi:hypothetical protein
MLIIFFKIKTPTLNSDVGQVKGLMILPLTPYGFERFLKVQLYIEP